MQETATQVLFFQFTLENLSKYVQIVVILTTWEILNSIEAYFVFENIQMI